MNRWQALVEDHRAYKAKMEETERWLGPLEQRFSESQGGEFQSRVAALGGLSSEVETGQAKLASLTAAGERLYPDTAASGRDNIRLQLRNIRDRCVYSNLIFFKLYILLTSRFKFLFYFSLS